MHIDLHHNNRSLNIVKHTGVKLLFVFLIMHLAFRVQCQPCEIDTIVFKIYNLEFNDIPFRVEALKHTSLDLAQYLETDYLWWKMIVAQNIATETEFLSGLNKIKLQDNRSNEKIYSNLFYYTYIIRYENLKHQYFTKYLTILKFHLYLNQLRSNQIIWPNSFMCSLFNLVDLSEEYMKNKLLFENGFKSKDNLEKYNISLSRLESINNIEYGSFEIIKHYYLGKIYFEVEKDYANALIKFEKLSILCPGNSIFKDYLKECQKKTINSQFSADSDL